MRRATDPPLELDSPAVRAAVDELMSASGYSAEDAARIIRGAAALLRELNRPESVEGRLRSLGFIDYPSPGQVVAQPVLFLEARG